jgi:F420H(2)-dependent quinone reductase
MPDRPEFFDSRLMAPCMKIFSTAHVAVFRITGGRVGGRFRFGSAFPHGVPVCLLTTRGRKTGEPRTIPLLFLRDGDRVVIVASRGGTGIYPQWYRNLKAEPRTLVQVGHRRRPMRAREADGQERTQLWRRLVEMYPEYGAYQSWTERTIPIVVCEPS